MKMEGYLNIIKAKWRKDVSVMGRLLWMVIVVLIVIWVLGLVLKIGGGLIHLLLLIAGIILVVQLITGKRKL